MTAKFSTGKPCGRGHVSHRLVSSGACCQCQREVNRARYVANQEKILADVHAYRASNPDKIKAQHKAWRNAHLDSERGRDKARLLANKDKYLARLAAWTKANPERTKARVAAWQKANPEKVTAKAAQYRASKLKQTPAWADHSAIAMIYRAAEVIRTTGFDVHVDHVVPLQGRVASGLHVHRNLQILEATANRSKSNHL